MTSVPTADPPRTVAAASRRDPGKTSRSPGAPGSAGEATLPKNEISGSGDDRLWSANVQPIRRIDETTYAGTAGKQLGKGLSLDADDLTEWNGVDDRATEDVAARVDPVRHRLRHLLEKGSYPSLLVHRNTTESACVVDLGEMEGDVRVVVPVPFELRRQVVTRQHVPVENQNRVIGLA